MKKIILIILLCCHGVLNAQDVEAVIKAKPFEISGSLAGNLQYYNSNNENSAISPLQYGISARLNISIYSFDIPIYASFRDNKFNYGSNFSRFRINPRYKWIQLFIGDTYMNFSPYVLNGRTVKGFGLKLNPGIFKFQAVYGKLNDLKSFRDTLDNGVVPIPTYSRKLAGLQIGLGKENLNTNFSYVRTWDVEDSLLFSNGINRMSNSVVGNSTTIRFSKVVKFTGNIAYSVLSSNLESFGEKSELGSNTVTGSVVDYNLSTYGALAGDVELSLDFKKIGFNVKSRYIQPYYNALSVAYLNNDLLNTTIGLKGRLGKKFYIYTNIGIQRNNISKTKSSTSNNLIFSLNANWRIRDNMNLSGVYTNYAQDYTARSVNFGDLYTYAVTNQSASLNYRISPNRDKSMAMYFSTNAGRAEYKIVEDDGAGLNDYNSNFLNVRLGSKFNNIDLDWSISGNYRSLDRVEEDRTYMGINNRFSKTFFEKRLSLSLSTYYKNNLRADKKESHTFSNMFSAGFKLNDKSSISGSYQFLTTKGQIVESINTNRAMVRYNYIFK